MRQRLYPRDLAQVGGAPDFGTYLGLDNAPGLRRTARFRMNRLAEEALHPAVIGTLDEALGGRCAPWREVMCDQTTLGRLPR